MKRRIRGYYVVAMLFLLMLLVLWLVEGHFPYGYAGVLLFFVLPVLYFNWMKELERWGVKQRNARRK